MSTSLQESSTETRKRLKLPKKLNRVGHALRTAGRRCFDYLDPIETSRWPDPKERKALRRAFGRAFEVVIRSEEHLRISASLEYRRFGTVVIGGHDGSPHYIDLTLQALHLPRMDWPRSSALWIDFQRDAIVIRARDSRHPFGQTLYPRFRLV